MSIIKLCSTHYWSKLYSEKEARVQDVDPDQFDLKVKNEHGREEETVICEPEKLGSISSSSGEQEIDRKQAVIVHDPELIEGLAKITLQSLVLELDGRTNEVL
jgi:hypothetical protein